MIVGIVIIVITFGIVALVYTQLITPIDIDRSVCHTSAVTRGTLPEIAGGVAKELISLKCKTKRICVTTKNVFQGRGECSYLLGEDFSTYRIKKDKADQQIKLLLAREMADCWEMLGKGNIAIFGREMRADNSIGAIAVVCSRIHFDETITGNKEGQLGIQEIQGFNQYLLSRKVPNHEVSYWDFLRNAYDGETIDILSGPMIKGKEENVLNFLNEELQITDTKAIVFMEVRPTLAGAMIGAPIGGTIGAIAGAKAGFTGFFMGLGGGTAIGWKAGDAVHVGSLRADGLFSDGTSAAGTFLTDYDLKGFQEIIPTLPQSSGWTSIWNGIRNLLGAKNTKEPTTASFEIASYA
jgi:hypothetical protein